MTRPNILYIHSHDTGRCVQPYGYAVPTPHLQQLAEQGVLFRQAFCASPTCSPSRAALLTGQYPHTNGMIGLAHRGSRLNDYSRHLAGVLGRAGYATALAGVQHEVRAEEQRLLGYGEILTDEAPPAGCDRDEWAADRACAFFEATQLAGFETGESLKLFGRPPPGYRLALEPCGPRAAQDRFEQRCRVLLEACGYTAIPSAFDSE